MMILDNITTTIAKGGITAIIGPNGAGKSTLLLIIDRLLMPSFGYVTVGDLDVITKRSDLLAKRLAILCQENQLSTRLTVEELAAFGRFPHNKGRLTDRDRKKSPNHWLF